MNYFLRLSAGFGVMVLGVGLAGVPAIAQGMRIVELLREPSLLLHTPSQSYLGVDVGDVDQERVAALRLKDTRGAEITVLDHDAPAGKVGLKLHDVILQMNGQAIENAEQFKRMLRETPIGRKVELLVMRDSAQIKVTAQMANRRKVQEEARKQIGGAGSSCTAMGFLSCAGDPPMHSSFHLMGSGNSFNVGASVEPLTAQMADFLGLSSGVMINNVARKSAAEAAGLKPHDVILQIGGEAVVTSSDWERLLRASEGRPIQVEILRDRMKQLVLLQVDGKRPKK